LKFRRRLNRWCMHMFCSLRSDFLISNLWNSRVISGCLNFDMLASKQRSIFYECGLDKMRSRRRHLIWITTMLSTHTGGSNTNFGGPHTRHAPKKGPTSPRNSVSEECVLSRTAICSIHPSIHPFAGCATEAREIYGQRSRGVGDDDEDEQQDESGGHWIGLLIDSRHSVAGTWTS